MSKKRITRDVTAEHVNTLIRYEPESGLFYRLSDRGGYKAGEVVGGFKDGYRIISVDACQYRAHHLAWLVMTGGWPPEGIDIDHIDRDRSNNAWANLRLATRCENNMNLSVRTDNKSGYRGVGLRKDTGKWYARIKAYGKLHLLGHFDTFDQAKAARVAAEEKHFADYAAK